MPERIRKSAEDIVETFMAKMDEFCRDVDRQLDLITKREVTPLHIHIPEPVAPIVKVEGSRTEVIVPAPKSTVRDVERDDEGRTTRIIERPGE